jgi:hypothetical protein
LPQHADGIFGRSRRADRAARPRPRPAGDRRIRLSRGTRRAAGADRFSVAQSPRRRRRGSLQEGRAERGLPGGRPGYGPATFGENGAGGSGRMERIPHLLVRTRSTQPGGERVERRAGTGRNVDQQNMRQTQNRGSVSQALDRVRQAATVRGLSQPTPGRSRMP